MAKQTINFGSASDGSQGDTARAAFTKINANFDEVYPALDTKAPLASPAFTGTPSAVTPALGDNSTRLQTTAGVLAQIQAYGIGNATAPTVTDASAVSNAGLYRVLFSAANIPIGTSGVLQHYAYDASSYTQIFAPSASATTRLFALNKFGAGSRTPWREVAMLDSPSFTGSLQSAGPVRPGQYTMSSLPSASAFSGYEIDVTDAAGGAKRCRSDGTNWKILNTTTTVS